MLNYYQEKINQPTDMQIRIQCSEPTLLDNIALKRIQMYYQRKVTVMMYYQRKEAQ